MSRLIRVVVLNCEYPPLGGGAATATEKIIEEFARLPVEVDLVTSSPSSKSTRQINDRCRGHFLPVGKKDVHYWTNRELMTYAFRSFACARELHRERRFEVCHAFFTLPAGAVAWRLRRRFPFIVSLRGSDVPGFSGRYRRLYGTAKSLFRRIWRTAAAVTANSNDLAALAQETLPGLAVDIIPNGVDTGLFRPGEPSARPPTVLTVARLIPRKNVATAVRAAAALAKDLPGLRWTIVGEGPLEDELLTLAKSLGVGDKVALRRYVPRGEMPDVYRSADAFLLTSGREGMSNTVLEALASGLPVVASREALSGMDFPQAHVVGTHDPEAAARALLDLLTNEDKRSSEGTGARRTAEGYTWAAAAEMFCALYERVLEERKG
ncbi:MAG: glycosyltransferase [Planctomycetota bacterium]|jgi:glycosyltransferase involved in cell wall biosynthesis